jgi:prepilin-type N-terminal cleavage/methylation domain-containing protein
MFPTVTPAPSQEIPLRITPAQRGFTLLELAIVMFVVALLLGGMLMPLGAQRDIRALAETEKSLEKARDALLGFAVINERLPCPATANSSGRETFCSTADYPCTGSEQYSYDTPIATNGYCFNYYAGYLPAATLGIQPSDANGFALDEWGGNVANRIRYAVSTNSLHNYSTASPPVLPTPFVLTRTQGLKGATLKPDLSVCNSGDKVIYPSTSAAETATGQTNYARCASGFALVEDAVAIVYSLGKNAGTGGTGRHEKHNPNPQSAALVAPDPAFVNAQPSTADDTFFDDSLLWISGNTLVNRLVTAGKL